MKKEQVGVCRDGTSEHGECCYPTHAIASKTGREVHQLVDEGRQEVHLAERIFYGAMDSIEGQTRRPAMEIFELAMRNATPVLEVKPRRVGGSTYQVPVEIRGDRRQALAMRWLIRAARARSGRSMAEKLAAELTRRGQQHRRNGQAPRRHAQDG